jgi:hypothetical protein
MSTNVYIQLWEGRLFDLVDAFDTHRRGRGEIGPKVSSVEALEEHTRKPAAFFLRYHVADEKLLKWSCEDFVGLVVQYNEEMTHKARFATEAQKGRENDVVQLATHKCAKVYKP